MSVNKVILVGNLGKDPELRYTAQQNAVCSFTIATNERRKDQTGKWVDHTEWHNIVAWGKTAETCGQYLKKGRQIYLEGKIQTRKWQDKEGKDRYTTEIVAQTVQFIGGGRGADSGVQAFNSSGPSEEEAAGTRLVGSLPSADAIAAKGGAGRADEVPFDDDDIPF